MKRNSTTTPHSRQNISNPISFRSKILPERDRNTQTVYLNKKQAAKSFFPSIYAENHMIAYLRVITIYLSDNHLSVKMCKIGQLRQAIKRLL